jgi:Holliday junction resolvase RusA-like endonuclease
MAASTPLTFSVPWAALCSDNRKFISGQFILSKEYRESKHVIGQLALAAAKKAKWVRAEGPLALEVVVREPDRRRRDLNWSKNAKDGISSGEGVWWDDSQVRWELWRFDESGPPDKATAGATITIRVLDNFRDVPNTNGNDAPLGRPGQLRPAPAEGLQRARRVRGGAAAPVEPAGAVAERAGDGRRQAGAPRQRRPRGAVAGGAESGPVEAGAVRPQAKAPRASRRHERTE